MYEKPPFHEQLGEDLWAFYLYIFDGLVPEPKFDSSVPRFTGDVVSVHEMILRFNEENNETRARVLLMVSGERVPLPYLSACDPEDNLFMVVGPETGE